MNKDSGLTNEIASSPIFKLVDLSIEEIKTPSGVSIFASSPLKSFILPNSGLFSPTKVATNGVKGLL